MRKLSFVRTKSAGFSLVELLTAIAILGILAFIALPTINLQLTEAKKIRAKRDAQTIASVAANAQAAGDPTIEQATDLTAAIAKVRAGVPGLGPFAHLKFAVPNLTRDTIAQASAYLTWENGKIHYTTN
jgi:prepilin-type N-terminal cleavage/methylation domain-containing protein